MFGEKKEEVVEEVKVKKPRKKAAAKKAESKSKKRIAGKELVNLKGEASEKQVKKIEKK